MNKLCLASLCFLILVPLGADAFAATGLLSFNASAVLEGVVSGAAAAVADGAAGASQVAARIERLRQAIAAAESVEEIAGLERALKHGILASGAGAGGGAGAEAAGVAPPAFRSVQLRKQYVPVIKENRTIAYKTAYFGSLYIGEKELEAFTVVFDTGSGHLILPSGTCQSEPCKKHKRYNRTDSAVDIEYDGSYIKSEANDRDQVSIAFGTGEVMGEFIREVVCLGEGEHLEACVNLRVVLATEMTEDPFSYFAFDGVLGLGLKALTLDPHFSFFSQMVKQHPFLKPQFAVFLSRHDEGENVISFGGIDLARGTEEMRWAPVIMEEMGYWMVQIKSLRIGDTEIEECADGSCRAILDTGTSLLGVPHAVIRTMHRLLARVVPAEQPQNIADIDCRGIPGHKMTFDLGGPVVSITEEDYSRPTPFNMTVPGPNASANASSWRLFCRSLLLPVDMEAPVGPKVFIWGEPVLRRYYTAYDLEKRQIGFSLAADAPEDVRGAPAVDSPPLGSHISGAPMLPPSARRKQAPAATTTTLEIPAGGVEGTAGISITTV